MSSRNIPSSDVKPSPKPDIVNVHTLSMFVANKPGVLGRVCAVFSRRGFNIDSLVVSQGRDPRYSRMTVGISGHPEGLSQIILQCRKLIDVIHCFEHTDRDSVVKEMVLIKLLVSADHRTEVLQIVEHFNGKTVDLQEQSMIVMISGNSDKVDAAVNLLAKFEIIETVRTGKVVMARGTAET
ncbi:acetolactate synthase small subunit [Roseimicrobium gellanilyticum]|uniref:Acetolactate synthase small subunit n=1 Tax=Roseimicrobium gellanilyticum TaxID=748857 RepID=A0A366HQK2_9BACT|nr:acetolactate synthase small subunit [Roseimicrobium gellanilyticum]RBP45139.1 acetolactate synthase small subunit [Roseimicrobium gellanilyticum]